MNLKENCKNLMKKISQRIKDLLHKKDIKGNELARNWGVSESYIGQIKNEKTSITVDKCLIMAKELNVRPELILLEMLHDKEKNPSIKSELKKITERLEKSSD